MSPSPGPTFHTLTPDMCEALLARHHVGRLAFAFHDRVDIQPINYVYDEGMLFGRTSEGAKLSTLEHNHWVAFEVDEIRGIFAWESVVVQGTFRRLDPNRSAKEREETERAVHRMRTIVPDTFTHDDPVAFRTVLFQITIREITGRAAVSAT